LWLKEKNLNASREFEREAGKKFYQPSYDDAVLRLD